MFVIESDKTLFVDVDDTLVMWNGHTYTPHLEHIELIKRFKERRQPVIVWSAGGYEWALRVVQELKLEQYITAVMAKPEWWMDDKPAHEVLLSDNRIYLSPSSEKDLK